MDKKQNIKYVQNFATLTAHDGGGRMHIVTDTEGNETGFEVSGLLTTFDLVNDNGMAFKRESYDRFVTDYFQRNDLNVPVCLQHDDTDIRNICGVVREMHKTDTGVVMTAFVPRCAYYYNLIKQYVELGVLQGFSNFGGVADAEWDDAGNLVINDFELLHVALVTTPGDTTARFAVQNTRFNGFNPVETQKTEKESVENKAAGDDWRDIV